MTPVCTEWQEERGPYLIRLAKTTEDREMAQRLRFAVFSQEFGATVHGAEQQLDIDPLDARADHLLVLDRDRDQCVGTYRLATWEQVGPDPGFYTERIFDMSRLDPSILRRGVELGRACVMADHRTRGVFQFLLRGIGVYLVRAQKQFLFGCGSVPLPDLGQARHAIEQVELQDWLDPTLSVRPTERYTPTFPAPANGARPEIPALLYTYCAFGARLAPSPAYDPDFRTMDFFVLLDLDDVSPRAYARYCQTR